MNIRDKLKVVSVMIEKEIIEQDVTGISMISMRVETEQPQPRLLAESSPALFGGLNAKQARTRTEPKLLKRNNGFPPVIPFPLRSP